MKQEIKVIEAVNLCQKYKSYIRICTIYLIIFVS